jgi:DeoR family fructose operon transcriptional repressor
MTVDNNETLFAEERQERILQLLKDNRKIMVPELCKAFSVSPATIRNDLRELESTGLLRRTHGGAITANKAGFELNSHQKEIKNISDKRAIARRAAEFIVEGDTLAIDTGTTTLEFVKQIVHIRGITIMTNDIMIASYMEEHSDATVILIGGVLRRNFHCTTGPIACKYLEGFNVDKAIMATNGITIRRGLTTPEINQAEVKKAMIETATEVIVLSDSSKIGVCGFVQFAPLTSIHKLVTDDGISEEDVNEMTGMGIEVIQVKRD